METKRSSKALSILITSIFYIANILLSSEVVFAKESYAINVSTETTRYLSGNIIAQEVSKELATVDPFEILSKNSDNGTEMVDVSSKIIINFSDAVDKSSLTSTNFIIKSNEDTPITVSTTITADSSNAAKVIITPRSKLGFNKTYTVIASKDVKSKSQISLGQDISWTFKTIRSVTSLSVEPANIIVSKDKPQDAKVYAVYADNPGVKEDVTAYASAKPLSESIAKINQSTITGVAVGTTSITYSLGGKSKSVNVKVVQTPDNLVVSTNKLALEAGKSYNMKATANYSNKSSDDITSSAVWVSGDDKVVTVNRGIISANSNAQVGAHTTVVLNYLGFSIPVDVSIVKPVKKLTTSNSTVVLPAGGSKSIQLTVAFSDGSTAVNVEDEVAAVSSNLSVVKVSGGKITAVAAGTAQVTFNYGSQKATVSITVKPELESLEITSDTISMETGDKVNVKAVATYINDKTEDVTKYVDWSSSDSDKLSVLQGTIYANMKSDDPININAIYGLEDKKATVPVIITPAVRTLTSDVSSSIAITKGQTLKVNLSAKYVNISYLSEDVTNKAAMNSIDTTIASVSKDGIRGNALGTTNIIYKYGSKTITISVTVKTEPDYITVNASKIVVESSGSASVKVTAHYSNNTTEDITKFVSYKINDSKVAKINQGTISASENEGSTELDIYYGTSDPIKLTVIVLGPEEKVSALDTNKILRVDIGNTVNPIVTAMFSDKDWLTASNLCIWESNNNEIVTIDPATGGIKGLKEGKATVTVKFCSKSAVINVIVARP